MLGPAHRPGRRTAAVTGAFGTLGRAIVQRLATNGCDVVAIGRAAPDPDDGGRDDAAWTDRVRRLAGVDLSTRAGVDACIAALTAIDASPDILVALAATPSRGDLGEFTDGELSAAMFVKVWGPALLAERFAPAMASRGWGRVVLASGVTGREPVDGYLVGGAVNAAVRSITKGLAIRWAAGGVTVNAVCPGPVASRRFEAVVGIASSREPRSAFMHGPSGMPSGRYLSPEEVAGAVSYLCGDDSAGVNGTEFVVDGAASSGL